MHTPGIETIIATAVPLLALGVLIRVGHSARRVAPLIVIALLWGFAATYVVLPLNDRWAAAYGLTSTIVLGAPIIEEIAKALCLPFLTASRRCSWFVDGAIIGLASGTGFAIRENWIYLRRAPEGTGIALALGRVSSTNLMHAGCTAIVGAALAVALRRRWYERALIGLTGLMIAIVIHATFNRATESPSASAALVTVIGVAAFAVSAGIVALGIPISRRWVHQDLAASGRSPEDQFLLAGGHRVHTLLAEFDERYGHIETHLVEDLIALHHDLAIAHHSGHRTEAEMVEMERRAEQLEAEIGPGPMHWLRGHVLLAGRKGAVVLASA